MAEKKTGFNLAEALAGVSKLDTGIKNAGRLFRRSARALRHRHLHFVCSGGCCL